ncbi:MAG: FtsQ-type POTRA domain-containing protein [Deltaproteobacteria bacterium]|nr:FtsQ-type POTRA domain-containing protein [Deltaproteobacteria bacterium]
MKRDSKKKKDVLQRQTVRRKRKERRPALRFGMIWSVCKGCLKGVGAVLVLALISFSFLSAYHYLVTSSYLNLEQVEVKGVQKELKAQLLTMADLAPGASLLALNLRALKQRLEEHPWIRSVELERRFPHTLLIRVEKQEPRAILLRDSMYYLNRYGEPFKRVGPSEDADFPLVTGVQENGNGRRGELEEVARLMEGLREEKSPWSLADLSEIHIEDKDHFTLYFEHMDAGIRVSGKALRKEVQELRRVVAHLARSGRIRKVSSIDFGYTGGAVVSFRKG